MNNVLLLCYFFPALAKGVQLTGSIFNFEELFSIHAMVNIVKRVVEKWESRWTSISCEGSNDSFTKGCRE